MIDVERALAAPPRSSLFDARRDAPERSDPMATEFLMPKLGLTMEEGTIIDWLVADGEQVEADAP